MSRLKCVMGCILFAVASCGTGTPAFDKDAGQFGDVPDNVRSWFKSVRSPHGIPCCDVADGHRTEAEIRGDAYWVPINGNLVKVQQDAVVYNAGNPYGEPVIWYVVQTNGDPYIRCFVPGGGV